MLKLARQPSYSREPVRAPAIRHEPAITVGKQSLTAALEAGHLGAPDHYTRAIETALRELTAVRSCALPAYIAVLRRTDLTPLAREIERTRVGLQVRHLLRCANASVHALEAAATHRDPMVEHLRESLDALVARATAIGVYRDALNERPRRAIDDDKPRVASTHSVKPKRTRHKPHATRSMAAPTQPAELTRARTRLGRGTGTPPPNTPARTSPTTSPSTPAARITVRPAVRPGFRL